MNDKIEQCKADIAKLQEELKKLQEPVFMLGDVLETQRGSWSGTVRMVVYDDGKTLVAIDEGGTVRSGGPVNTCCKGLYKRLYNDFEGK